jgi:transcriptional regulator with XRE-family HTH domain
MTQAQLAGLLKKTRQLPAQWESGDSGLTVETALQLCQVLGCSIEWLLEGRGSDEGPKLLIEGEHLPIVLPELLVEIYRKTMTWREQARTFIGHIAKPGSFILEHQDDSMDPAFKERDRLVFDPAQPIKPGSLVSCVVDLDPGNAEPVALFRKVKLLTSKPGAPLILLPLNSTWPEIKVDDDAQIVIFGSLSASWRRH